MHPYLIDSRDRIHLQLHVRSLLRELKNGSRQQRLHPPQRQSTVAI